MSLEQPRTLTSETEKQSEAQKRRRKLMFSKLSRLGSAGLLAINVNACRLEYSPRPRTGHSADVGEMATDTITRDQMVKEIEDYFDDGEARLKYSFFSNAQERTVLKDATLVGDSKSRIKKEFFTEPVKIEGFDEIGVSEAGFRKILDTYPRGWVKASNIKTIRVAQEKRMAYSTGYYEFANCHLPFNEPGTINFTSTQLNENMSEDIFDDVIGHNLSHEIVHANDPLSSPDITESDRVELVWRSIRAVENEGRPYFRYPEKIEKTETKGNIKVKLVEYLAELTAFALDVSIGAKNWDEWRIGFEVNLVLGKEATPEAAKENALLVEKILRATDPDFKPWEAVLERTNAREDLRMDFRREHIKRALEKLDPMLQVMLRSKKDVSLEDHSTYWFNSEVKTIQECLGKKEEFQSLQEIDEYMRALVKLWNSIDVQERSKLYRQYR